MAKVADFSYSGVNPKEGAPIIVTEALAGQNGKGLAFSRPLDAGQVVFCEIPLVVDASHMISPEEHELRHNSRFAWSIVEEALKTLPAPLLQSLLSSDYATGIVNMHWDSAGDARALAYMVATYQKSPESVGRLYDVMATNCIVADVGMKRIEVGGRVVHVPVPLYGFFALLSRANHSCRPSASLSKRPGRATFVITTRAVAAGEALTIDYLQTEPAATKRRELFKQFGFYCACAHCKTRCALLSCNEAGDKWCSKCHTARYCSREHQVEDWARHKAAECHHV